MQGEGSGNGGARDRHGTTPGVDSWERFDDERLGRFLDVGNYWPYSYGSGCLANGMTVKVVHRASSAFGTVSLS